MGADQDLACAELIRDRERHAAFGGQQSRGLRALDLVDQVVLRVFTVDRERRRRLDVGLVDRNAKQLRRHIDDAAGLDVEWRILERHEIGDVLRLDRILDLVALQVIERQPRLCVRQRGKQNSSAQRCSKSKTQLLHWNSPWLGLKTLRRVRQRTAKE